MLSDRELDVARRHKEPGFGAYLAWAWLEYPYLQADIKAGKPVKPGRLSYANKRMAGKKFDFDFCYLESLPQEEVNPLQVEQDAWRLLSPLVASYIESFDQYIQGYHPEIADTNQLLAYVTTGFELLKKWNIISKLFGEKCYIASYKELPSFANIPDENWFRGIPEKEKAVIDLIQELAVTV